MKGLNAPQMQAKEGLVHFLTNDRGFACNSFSDSLLQPIKANEIDPACKKVFCFLSDALDIIPLKNLKNEKTDYILLALHCSRSVRELFHLFSLDSKFKFREFVLCCFGKWVAPENWQGQIENFLVSDSDSKILYGRKVSSLKELVHKEKNIWLDPEISTRLACSILENSWISPKDIARIKNYIDFPLYGFLQSNCRLKNNIDEEIQKTIHPGFSKSEAITLYPSFYNEILKKIIELDHLLYSIYSSTICQNPICSNIHAIFTYLRKFKCVIFTLDYEQEQPHLAWKIDQVYLALHITDVPSEIVKKLYDFPVDLELFKNFTQFYFKNREVKQRYYKRSHIMPYLHRIRERYMLLTHILHDLETKYKEMKLSLTLLENAEYPLYSYIVNHGTLNFFKDLPSRVNPVAIPFYHNEILKAFRAYLIQSKGNKRLENNPI